MQTTLYTHPKRVQCSGLQRLKRKTYAIDFGKHPCAALLYDPKHCRLMDVNTSACVQYGYSRKELLSLQLTDLYITPHGHEKSCNPSTEKPQVGTCFTKHVTKQGACIDVAMCVHALSYQKKELLLIQTQDISKHLHAHNTLHAQNKQLRSFAYMAPHNLRAAITNVSALLRLIEKNKIHHKRNLEIIEKIEQSVQKTEHTLCDLMQLTHLQAHTQQNRTAIDLYKVYDNIRQQISHDITCSGAQINLYLWQQHVVQPSAVIENIFLNMLTNAIKYRCKQRTLHINIYSERYKQYMLLCFEDNGLGMDLHLYGDKVFGLYQRFHRGVAAGKGIGLHVVHAQVNALGGSVEVKSKKGKGSAFYLYLKNEA